MDGGRPSDAAAMDGEASSQRRDGGPVLPPAAEEIVLPYRGPTVTRTLSVSAEPARLDVCFSVDTTGSFGEEIDAMQDSLGDRIVPALEDRVRDVAFAVSRFEDFPESPFGAPQDRPFELLTRVTTSRSRIGAAVAALDQPLGNGGDIPESGAEALWQIATGEGYPAGRGSLVPAFDGRPALGGGSLGGVGFREGALHVVVHITDAPTHAAEDYAPALDDVHSLDESIEALDAVGARVLGIASGRQARPHLERLALATGADVPPEDGVCPTGIGGMDNSPVDGRCPLVFDVRSNGSGLSEAIVDAIVDVVDAVQFDEVWGEAPDDELGFVRAIAAVDATPPDGVDPPARADRRPPDDGVDDTFLDVRSGTEVELEVRFANDRIAPAPDYDQVFRVLVNVVGDGRTLAERVFRIIVPAGRFDAGAADAGASSRDATVFDAAGDAGADGS